MLAFASTVPTCLDPQQRWPKTGLNLRLQRLREQRLRGQQHITREGHRDRHTRHVLVPCPKQPLG